MLSDVIPRMGDEMGMGVDRLEKRNVQGLLKNVINKYFNNSYHEMFLRRLVERVKISTDRHRWMVVSCVDPCLYGLSGEEGR